MNAITPSPFIDIATMAKLYDVSHRTLRFYEDAGLLSPKREGTARLYSARDRIRLEIILKGKRLGFSLREIEALMREKESGATAVPDEVEDVFLPGHMSREMIEEQLALMEARRAEAEHAIQQLEAALRQSSPADRREAVSC